MNYSINNWTITLSDNNSSYDISIPPTDGDRIDVILGKDYEEGYRYKPDCIIIHITGGKITQVLIQNSSL